MTQPLVNHAVQYDLEGPAGGPLHLWHNTEIPELHALHPLQISYHWP